MPASVFHRACLMQSGRIAGFRVRPLSCWHVMALDALDNPAVVGGEFNHAALLQLILVCRDEWTPDSSLALHRRFVASPLFRWAFSVAVLCHRLDRARADVRRYLDAYMDVPQYWSSGDEARSRVPGTLCVAARLMPVLGEARAWNMPFSLACAYKAALDERDGAKLADDDIAAAERAFAKREAVNG